MSDAVPEIYIISNAEISLLLSFSIVTDFVFHPVGTTLTHNEADAAVCCGRNNKLSLSAIYSDKIAVGKPKII